MACDCCGGTVVNTPENESLTSVVENFVRHFFGAPTKSLDAAGNVVWALPCSLDTGLPGNPRIAGEGLACYFLRLFEAGVTGVAGRNGFAVSTQSYEQPVVGGTVTVSVDTTDPFAEEQYIWCRGGGFYTVVAVGTGTITLRNLYGPPHNLSALATVPSGEKFVPSGVPETAGPKGDKGDKGDTVVGPQGPEGKQGKDGIQGPIGPSGSEPARLWRFKTNGTYQWVCPSNATTLRLQLVGGGGGGGGGGTTASGGLPGKGGGGGEYVDKSVFAIPSGVYTIVVGAGGAGGAGATAGGNGGSSQVNSATATLASANGGIGGGTVGGVVGTGGTGAVVDGETRYAGFAGSADDGGHAGREGVGGLGGEDGGTPGGGGGAGLDGGTGGGDPGHAGGNGQVIISVTASK